MIEIIKQEEKEKKQEINKDNKKLKSSNSQDYLEYIEIPIKKKYLFQNCEEKKEEVFEMIFDNLLEELVKNPKWGSFIYIMNENSKTLNEITGMTENEETVYGIRTNMNAISEYCSYLINYIEDNYIELMKKNIIEVKNKKKMVKNLEKNDISFNSQKICDDLNNNFGNNINKKPIKSFNKISDNIMTKNFNYKNLYDILDSNVIIKKTMDRKYKMYKDYLFEVWLTKANKNFIFSEKIYIDLEKTILDSYKDMQIMEELFKMQKIFHRCIFDAFNEILFSLSSLNKNFDFDQNDLKILKSKKISENIIDFYLRNCKRILLEKTMFCCGLIKDKEDSLFPGSLKDYDMNSISCIRKERLYKMILSEFKEEKQENLNYKESLNLVVFNLSKEIEDFLFDDLIKNFLV